LFDFFEKIDNFAKNDVPKKLIIAYFLLSLPNIISLMLPTACFLGALLNLSFLKRNNELVAIQACGMSPYRLSVSYLIIGIMLSLALFSFNEIVIPKTQAKANNIWLREVKGKPPKGGYFQERIWLKGQNSIYQIDAINLKTQTMFGVTIYFFTPQFKIQQRLDARKAKWDEKNKAWIFYEGIQQTINPDGKIENTAFQKKLFPLKETPLDFKFLEADYQQLSIWQLKKYIAKLKSQGYDSTAYAVDFWQRTAQPLTPIILIIFAISLVLKGKEIKIGFTLSLGIVIAFIFWIIQALSIALGKGGHINPFLAGWLPNIIFAAWGIIMLRYVNE
jgi:lipopolysaccharide export system permease protein